MGRGLSERPKMCVRASPSHSAADQKLPQQQRLSAATLLNCEGAAWNLAARHLAARFLLPEGGGLEDRMCKSRAGPSSGSRHQGAAPLGRRQGCACCLGAHLLPTAV